VLIGYMRVSKADGSQTLDLQRDALLAAGIDPGHLYEDQASGKRDNRPGLEACLKALRQGDTPSIPKPICARCSAELLITPINRIADLLPWNLSPRSATLAA
jgi:hypothetical protein